MRINKVLQKDKDRLKKKNIDNVDFEAGSILAFALKKPREYLFTHPEHVLSPFEWIKNELLMRKRLSATPLAYLTGSREFFGLDFKVNKSVLIPRPETELMVEQALSVYREHGVKSFLDVGTGSGCIIVTLALKIPQGSFVGLDISKKALTTAKNNAKRHKVEKRIRFLRSNLIREVMNDRFDPPMMILANLPYLTPKQVEGSPSIKKEPKLALLGGDDGLEYYHMLFKQVRACRMPRPLFILCEIDEKQGKKILDILRAELPSADMEIKKDLKGLPRLAVISLPKAKDPGSPRISHQHRV